MRGKRAKKLRRIALHYVLTKLKVSAGEGHGQYNQAMNMLKWERQVDSDGFPMKDPGGGFLLTPTKMPGTITNAWKWRVLYRILKKQWKAKQSLSGLQA
jgi:hypothetical protein